MKPVFILLMAALALSADDSVVRWDASSPGAEVKLPDGRLVHGLESRGVAISVIAEDADLLTPARTKPPFAEPVLRCHLRVQNLGKDDLTLDAEQISVVREESGKRLRPILWRDVARHFEITRTETMVISGPMSAGDIASVELGGLRASNDGMHNLAAYAKRKEDIQKATLQHAILKPGEKVKGFVYFEPVKKDLPVRLILNSSRGRFEIPLSPRN